MIRWHQFKWYQWIVFVLLLILFVSAFKPQPSFVGKTWVLSSYSYRLVDDTENSLKLYSHKLHFKSDDYLTFYSLFNLVEIHTSCRRGFLKFKIRDNRLRIYDSIHSGDQHMERCAEFPTLSKKDYRSLDLLRSSIYSVQNGKLILTLTSYYKENQGDQLIFSEIKTYPRRWFPYLIGQQILVLLNLIGVFPTLLGLFVLIIMLIRGILIWRKNKKLQQENKP